MACRKKLKLDSITTTEILDRLKYEKNTDFFYLYVSTADVEPRKRKQRNQPLPKEQQQLTCENPASNNNQDGNQDDPASNDDQDGDQDDDGSVDQDDSTKDQDDEIDDQGDEINDQEVNGTNNTPLSQDKAREKAMQYYVHSTTLPLILEPEGWKKVVDKDTGLTYKALYFNAIKKCPDEDKNKSNQRVARIRYKIDEEAKKLMDERKVNFKINSLLSRPFRYDEEALEEQSVQTIQTQQSSSKQRTLHDCSSWKK